MAAVAASLPADRPSKMKALSWDADEGAAVLLRRAWLDPEGRGYEMVRPTLDDIPVVPLPDGFDVRPIDDTAKERRRLAWPPPKRSATSVAKTSGPRRTGRSARLTRTGTRPCGPSPIDGDEVAAGVYGRIDPEENAHHGVLQGYIDGVWTRKPYRRRGLARALLAAGARVCSASGA